MESRNLIIVLIVFGGVAGLVAAFYLIPGQPGILETKSMIFEGQALVE